MDQRKRRLIAYIAGRLASAKPVNYIYDYSINDYVSLSGQVDMSRINVYDYSASNYVVGNGNDGIFNLFDYYADNYIQLRFYGGNFNGFDYASGVNFSGKATDVGTVSFYDYETGQYYDYQV